MYEEYTTPNQIDQSTSSLPSLPSLPNTTSRTTKVTPPISQSNQNGQKQIVRIDNPTINTNPVHYIDRIITRTLTLDPTSIETTFEVSPTEEVLHLIRLNNCQAEATRHELNGEPVVTHLCTRMDVEKSYQTVCLVQETNPISYCSEVCETTTELNKINDEIRPRFDSTVKARQTTVKCSIEPSEPTESTKPTHYTMTTDAKSNPTRNQLERTERTRSQPTTRPAKPKTFLDRPTPKRLAGGRENDERDVLRSNENESKQPTTPTQHQTKTPQKPMGKTNTKANTTINTTMDTTMDTTTDTTMDTTMSTTVDTTIGGTTMYRPATIATASAVTTTTTTTKVSPVPTMTSPTMNTMNTINTTSTMNTMTTKTPQATSVPALTKTKIKSTTPATKTGKTNARKTKAPILIKKPRTVDTNTTNTHNNKPQKTVTWAIPETTRGPTREPTTITKPRIRPTTHKNQTHQTHQTNPTRQTPHTNPTSPARLDRVEPTRENLHAVSVAVVTQLSALIDVVDSSIKIPPIRSKMQQESMHDPGQIVSILVRAAQTGQRVQELRNPQNAIIDSLGHVYETRAHVHTTHRRARFSTIYEEIEAEAREEAEIEEIPRNHEAIITDVTDVVETAMATAQTEVVSLNKTGTPGILSQTDQEIHQKIHATRTTRTNQTRTTSQSYREHHENEDNYPCYVSFDHLSDVQIPNHPALIPPEPATHQITPQINRTHPQTQLQHHQQHQLQTQHQLQLPTTNPLHRNPLNQDPLDGNRDNQYPCLQYQDRPNGIPRTDRNEWQEQPHESSHHSHLLTTMPSGPNGTADSALAPVLNPALDPALDPALNPALNPHNRDHRVGPPPLPARTDRTPTRRSIETLEMSCSTTQTVMLRRTVQTTQTSTRMMGEDHRPSWQKHIVSPNRLWIRVQTATAQRRVHWGQLSPRRHAHRLATVIEISETTNVSARKHTVVLLGKNWNPLSQLNPPNPTNPPNPLNPLNPLR